MQTSCISFLQSRIASIGTALFFCEDNHTLPFPAYIITALRTDDEGNIWFFISRSWNKAVSYNTGFPSSLEFYRKGYPFALTIEGQASLVNDKTAVRDFMQDLLGKSIAVKEEAITGVLLVKVKIEKSTCKELAVRKPHNPFRHVIAAMKNLWQPVPPLLQPSL